MLNLLKHLKPFVGSMILAMENAGKLIEDANLKGYKEGGATASTKHANFIINENKATSKDIINLISHIKKIIKEKDNIDLILEQEIVKWDSYE